MTIGGEYLKIAYAKIGIHCECEIIQQKYIQHYFNPIKLDRYQGQGAGNNTGNTFASSNNVYIVSAMYPAFSRSPKAVPPTSYKNGYLCVRGSDSTMDNHIFLIQETLMDGICQAIAEYNYLMRWWEHGRPQYYSGE